MRYMLDQEEMDALVPRDALERRTAALEVARVAILKASGFTCIHERTGVGHGRSYDCYCDDCPISRIGMPARLPWGHAGPELPPATKVEREADRLICTLSRNYSK